MNAPAEYPQGIKTRSGVIPFPSYVPVTTFGEKYPLDKLIQPYIPRLANAVMVSYHYAKQMKERPTIPLMVDSGGFASLFKHASIHQDNGLGIIDLETDDGKESITPIEVLDFQEDVADLAFTLDFPIPPKMSKTEAKKRLELTISNGLWAIENRRRHDLPLYACIQGWDAKSYQFCTAAVKDGNFDGIAIGGLVPRARDTAQLKEIISAVRREIDHLPIHVFGLGKPELVAELFDLGVQSVDSSSYVKLAASGRVWGQKEPIFKDASPMERLHLAVSNLAIACQASLPLSTLQRFTSPLFKNK